MHTIDRLYAAAIERDEWRPALEAVTDLLGAGHTVFTVNGEAGMNSVVGARVDERDLVRAFQRTLAVAAEGRLGLLDPSRLPRGVLVRRDIVVSDSEFARSVVYNEIVRSLNGFHSLNYFSAASKPGFSVSVCRPPGSENFGADEYAVLRAVLPHLANVVEIRNRLVAMEDFTGSIMRLFQRIEAGVVLTDATARPVFMNARAERIVAEADGLVLEVGGLSTASPPATRRLREAIAAAAGIGEGRDPRSSTPDPIRLCLTRPSQRPPLVATVLPVWRLISSPSGIAAPRVAVFVSEPDAAVKIDGTMLAEAFGLTSREREIAVLLGEGHDLKSIAACLSLGLGTVRNHLKRLFEKTDTHTQAALVVLLRGFVDPR